MSNKNLKKKFVNGAKPFEEVFDILEKDMRSNQAKTESMIKEFHDTQTDINNYFYQEISDIKKKEIFDLNTVYDIKDESVLEIHEQQYLASYLVCLANDLESVNDNQQAFVRSIIQYLGVSGSSIDVEYDKVEHIQSTKGQKAFIQVVMEFLFLATENMDDLEAFTELLDYFSVNKKSKEDIKNKILFVYNAIGAEGLIEKYGFVPVVDEEMIEENGSQTEQVIKFYDGKDISKACADKVNCNDYIELDDYIVFDNGAWLDNKNRFYRVSKSTGEKHLLEGEFFESFDIMKHLSDVYGFEKYLYMIICETQGICYGKYIIRFDVETFETEKIEFPEKLVFSYSASLGVNKTDIVYIAEKGNKLLMFDHKISSGETIVLDSSDIGSVHNFYLVGEKVFYTDRNTLYEYNLSDRQKRVIERNLSYKQSAAFSPRCIFGGDDLLVFWAYEFDKEIYYINLKDPLSVHTYELPVYGESSIYNGYGKVFYLTIDGKRELGFVDLKEKLRTVIQDDCKAVRRDERGVFKRVEYSKPIRFQIVGQWVYYMHFDDQSVGCIEIKET